MDLLFLHHLEEIKFQIFGLRDAPEDGVVSGLPPLFDLPEGHGRVAGRVEEHGAEELGGHETGA